MHAPLVPPRDAPSRNKHVGMRAGVIRSNFLHIAEIINEPDIMPATFPDQDTYWDKLRTAVQENGVSSAHVEHEHLKVSPLSYLRVQPADGACFSDIYRFVFSLVWSQLQFVVRDSNDMRVVLCTVFVRTARRLLRVVTCLLGAIA